jgi:hypothetical protein
MQALLLLLLVVTLELTHSFQSLKLPSSSRSFSLTQFKQKNEINTRRLRTSLDRACLEQAQRKYFYII